MRYQHDDEKLEWDEIKESSCVNVGEQGCDKELLSICVSNCADRPMCVLSYQPLLLLPSFRDGVALQTSTRKMCLVRPERVVGWEK